MDPEVLCNGGHKEGPGTGCESHQLDALKDPETI